VALGRRSLTGRELTARRLHRPFPLAVPTERAYYLVTSPQTAALPRVQAFRRWILAEAAREKTGRPAA
jgi:LysR family glycine cleavage system transcriptional activator